MKISLSQMIFAGALLWSSAAWSQSGALENPQPSGIESGIGVVSGWHCTSRNIEIRIDGVVLGSAGAGTSRGDTFGICGRTDTGFSLLLNYNLFRQGTHRIEALADGIAFGAATFVVGALGGEFLTGLSRPISVGDFPSQGYTTNMQWAQSKQNYVIEGSAVSNSIPIAGTYTLSQFSVVYSNGTVLNSGAPGVAGTGRMEIRQDGGVTQEVELTYNNSTARVTITGTFSDQGYYLRVTSNQQQANVGVLSRGNVLTTQALATATSQGFTEVDVWTRVGGIAANEMSSAPREVSLGQLGGLVGHVAKQLLGL